MSGIPVLQSASAVLTPQVLVVAITVLCIALWIRAPIPPGFTGILAIALIGVVLSPSVALHGFELPATWLVVFGLIIGETTRETGLATNLGRWLLHRGVPSSATGARRTYLYTLTVLCFAGLALTLLVPSSLVRVLVLGPIVREAALTQESDRARIGLYLAPLITTYQSSVGILTAGLQNIAVVGMLESMTDATVTWSEWFALMFPVMGVGRMVVVVAVMYVLFRPTPDAGATVAFDADDDLTADQRRLLLFLGVGVLIWATDFLHGLHPLFGAVAVVVLAMAPRIGVVPFERVEDVDFTIVFFFGAVFAIAAGLSDVGFTKSVVDGALTVLPSSLPYSVFLACVLVLSMALQLIIEALAVVSVLTPILVTYAQQAGLAVQPVVMTEAIASVSIFFPYQSAVLIAILGQDVVDFRTIAKSLVACTLVGTVVLVPIQIALMLFVLPT
ncbi:SLC13 family permease [Halobium palmae]|uniref:SLC13 family permease n=1 Tax=Halobium palmae TaxID=1776492 RepID=A0ABD5RZX0_9EURY